MSDEQQAISAAISTAEKIMDELLVNYKTRPVDKDVLAMGFRSAVDIYCANLIAKAIYSTGPV